MGPPPNKEPNPPRPRSREVVDVSASRAVRLVAAKCALVPPRQYVYRETESGKRDTQDGSRLVYVLTQIAKVLELTEIERRLILLEARTNGQLPGPPQEA